MSYVPKPLPSDDINSSEVDRQKLIYKSLVLLVFLMVSFYVSLSFLPAFLVKITPKSFEAKINERVIKKYLDKKSNNEGLDNFLQKLVKHSGQKDLVITSLDEDEENAFALPGGLIMMSDGFLRASESENETLFVIAHEMGHHFYRHPLKSFYSSLLSQGFSLLLGGKEIMSSLALHTTSMSFSRDQETESDEFALDLVYKVSGNLKGAFSFFKRMHQRQGNLEGLNGELFSTHPLSIKRIKSLEELCLKRYSKEECF